MKTLITKNGAKIRWYLWKHINLESRFLTSQRTGQYIQASFKEDNDELFALTKITGAYAIAGLWLYEGIR